MGLLQSIFGGMFGVAAAQPLEAIGNVLDKVTTTTEEKLAAQAVLEKIRQQPGVLQMEINKIEAQHRSVFVAGWRPFIGWVCGLALAWVYIGGPVCAWWLAVAHRDVTPPVIAANDLMELVLAMLGLGTLRTAEKMQGKAK